MAQAKQIVQALLSISSVRIKNVEATTGKIQKILNDGAKNLHFICDFDQTMSRYWVRNRETDALERNVSCHGLPGRYSRLGQDFKQSIKELLERYYPIEIDQSRTNEEKLPYMVEWWQKAHEALISQRLTREDIEIMVRENDIQLRTGIPVLLEQCSGKNIPFLVFSAGIGNIIEEILKERNLLTPNMHVVSNMMQFNAEGVCTAFSDPLIHVFNKSELSIEGTPYHATIEHRSNVVLMGDSLGDLQMSQGIRHDMCLNIGFCNHDFATLEPLYKDAFDIVIMNDANVNPIIEIINNL